MSDPRREHGIEHDPHLRSGHLPDPSERRAGQILNREAVRETDSERVEHNVWEEPSLSAELTKSQNGRIFFLKDGPGASLLTSEKLKSSIVTIKSALS